jgi:hypothetical protein
LIQFASVLPGLRVELDTALKNIIICDIFHT